MKTSFQETFYSILQISSHLKSLFTRLFELKTLYQDSFYSIFELKISLQVILNTCVLNNNRLHHWNLVIKHTWIFSLWRSFLIFEKLIKKKLKKSSLKSSKRLWFLIRRLHTRDLFFEFYWIILFRLISHQTESRLLPNHSEKWNQTNQKLV